MNLSLPLRLWILWNLCKVKIRNHHYNIKDLHIWVQSRKIETKSDNLKKLGPKLYLFNCDVICKKSWTKHNQRWWLLGNRAYC
jgi:hypothetical protein